MSRVGAIVGIRLTSRVSYGVYLFHIPVLAVMSAHWHHERRLLGVAYFVVSVAIATASYPGRPVRLLRIGGTGGVTGASTATPLS